MQGRDEKNTPDVLNAAQLIRIESVHRGFLYQHLYAVGCLLLAQAAGVDVVLVLPGVPTAVEAGFGNFKPTTWFGIFARSGVPPHILKQLNEAVREVMQSSQTRDYLKARGASSSDMGLDDFRMFFHGEIDMWADVIRKAQIKQ